MRVQRNHVVLIDLQGVVAQRNGHGQPRAAHGQIVQHGADGGFQVFIGKRLHKKIECVRAQACQREV